MSYWTKELIEETCLQGDKEADELATMIMSTKGGIHAYNDGLSLATTLDEAPGLQFSDKSRVHQWLDKLEKDSPELLNYYGPSVAPEWVSEEKLDVAASIWEDNTLACVGALYALSLPTSYLHKKGVVSLYETGKLGEGPYIFQRLFETGRFVKAVMGRGGVRVTPDYVPKDDDLYLKLFQAADPDGKWIAVGPDRLKRSAGTSSMPPGLAEKVKKQYEAETARKFLTGAGYLAAKKVRLLHASIRFMVLHPDEIQLPPSEQRETPSLSHSFLQDHPPAPWNKDAYGWPLGQSQLAFGLLTFSYLIPAGLKRFGVPLNDDQLKAFLHLWKVVGHVMGIRPDLLTDDPDEARANLELILKLEGGQTEMGTTLTDAICTVIARYFPDFPGLGKRLPAHLMIYQMGRTKAVWAKGDLDQGAKDVLPPESVKRARGFPHPLAFWGVSWCMWFYFRIRGNVLTKAPLIGTAVLSSLYAAASEFMESWQDFYRRRPFAINGSMEWVRSRGFSAESAKRLQRWRVRLFVGLLFGIFLLGLSSVMIALSGVAVVLAIVQIGYAIFDSPLLVARGLFIASIVSVLSAVYWLKWGLPKMFRDKERPELDPALKAAFAHATVAAQIPGPPSELKSDSRRGREQTQH